MRCIFSTFHFTGEPFYCTFYGLIRDWTLVCARCKNGIFRNEPYYHPYERPDGYFPIQKTGFAQTPGTAQTSGTTQLDITFE